MPDIHPQTSFNSGEWSPALAARVDLTKYRAGAALLSNYFVDYRGGASSRPGTKYVIQGYKSDTAIRLIPFQATFDVGYILEFGDHYIRFIYQGSPVLETGVNITAATKANPCIITAPGHTYSAGDWIFVSGVVGMTQLNGRYFRILNVSGNNLTLGALPTGNLDSTGYSTYTSGGTTKRIYTIVSPYAAADLAILKFAQNIDQMILCHPNYPAQVLSLISANDWNIAAIIIGSTAGIPTGVAIGTTLAPGSVWYSYEITSIDATGQESSPSSPAYLSFKQDIRSVLGSNSIGWAPVSGAVGYNVYESVLAYNTSPPIGSEYGFIGTVRGASFVDTNIAPNFSLTPPINTNPFGGKGLASITVTAASTYTVVPSISFSGGTPTVPGTAVAQLGAQGIPTITSAGTGFVPTDTVTFNNGLILQVSTTGGGGVITAWTVLNAGAITTGATPANPLSQVATSGVGTGAQASVTWGVNKVSILTSGYGYASAPTVVFTPAGASATATLSAAGNGNPSVPGFFQQRLVMASPLGAPQTFYMSQPGSYFNFDVTNPVQPDNAITGTLVSNTLNTIKSIVSSTAGMLILTDKASWLVNGGSSGSAISPSSIVANAQSFVGASDVPPIVANYDVLYIQSKGSGVRDLAFNIYFSVFTGTDISVLSSHLFYGFTINEWAWAEQPFYVAWAVRSDGAMLTLTFLKEQDFIGWAHSTTQGNFKSVATVTETNTSAGNVDAVYTVVQRTINAQSYQYIERVSERIFPNGLISSWMVDCGLQYVGSPTLNFQGAEQLGGLTIVGLTEDDQGKVAAITPFVMPLTGFFSLPAPPSPATGYTTVTLGLSYTYDLQTLALEVGDPTIQGKVKKISNVDVRVQNTLNLSIGPDFNQLQPMKDTIQGNVSSMLTGLQSQVVSDLYTGDARTFLASAYTVPGQYCIRGASPYPSSILGVFPSFVVGDDR